MSTITAGVPGLAGPGWGVGERVRYVGERWPSYRRGYARHCQPRALDLIEVTYEKLPVIGDPVQARRPETMALHESGNLLKHNHGRR